MKNFVNGCIWWPPSTDMSMHSEDGLQDSIEQPHVMASQHQHEAFEEN
jgi:hypothetical protein